MGGVRWGVPIMQADRRCVVMSDWVKALIFWLLVILGMGFCGGVERGYFL